MNANTTPSAVIQSVEARCTTAPATLALRRLGAAVGFALLTAAAAQVAIPLPFTPVPLTLQTLVVLVGAVALGPRWGTLGMVLYLLLGTFGYPAFALGKGGGQTLFGATGGFLLGFVLAQVVAGAFLHRPRSGGSGDARKSSVAPAGRPPRLRLLAGLLASEVVIYTCGVTWLAAWLDVDLGTAMQLGVWPFVIGDTIKVLLSVEFGRLAVPLGRRILRS